MEILAGKPYLWKSAVYGEIAVHVKGFSPNGAVAILTIDGGEASTPAQRFPEWSDGIAYAALEHGELVKRPSRRTPKKTAQKTNNGEVQF